MCFAAGSTSASVVRSARAAASPVGLRVPTPAALLSPTITASSRLAHIRMVSLTLQSYSRSSDAWNCGWSAVANVGRAPFTPSSGSAVPLSPLPSTPPRASPRSSSSAPRARRWARSRACSQSCRPSPSAWPPSRASSPRPMSSRPRLRTSTSATSSRAESASRPPARSSSDRACPRPLRPPPSTR